MAVSSVLRKADGFLVHSRVNDHRGLIDLGSSGRRINGSGFSLRLVILLSRATPTTVNHSCVKSELSRLPSTS